MSRTQESTGPESPVKKRYSMNMKKGNLSWQIDAGSDFNEMKPPLHFILLDGNGFRITGQSPKGKFKSKLHHKKLSPFVNIWQEIDMGPGRNKDKKDIMSGNWLDIKEAANDQGCRFQAVLFAVEPATKELITINLRGKGLSAWYKLLDDNKDAATKRSNDPAVAFSDRFFSITGFVLTPSSVGDDSYVPVFAMNKIKSPDTVKLADDKDAELQKYFLEIFGNAQSTVNREDVAEEAADVEDRDGDGKPDENGNWDTNAAKVDPPTGPPAGTDNSNPTDDLPFG